MGLFLELRKVLRRHELKRNPGFLGHWLATGSLDGHLLLLGDELPYATTVEIEKFEVEGDLRRVFAAIVVDRESHKPIVIGKGGEALKRIATEARQDMTRLFGGTVYLELWVKVKSGWTDDERLLRSLGYE